MPFAQQQHHQIAAPATAQNKTKQIQLKQNIINIMLAIFLLNIFQPARAAMMLMLLQASTDK